MSLSLPVPPTTPSRAARLWLGLLLFASLLALWPVLVPAQPGSPARHAGALPALPLDLLRLHLESSVTGMAVVTAHPLEHAANLAHPIPPPAGSQRAHHPH